MIWTDETRIIFLAHRNRLITSDEMMEAYSVCQRKPRSLTWTKIDDAIVWMRRLAG